MDADCREAHGGAAAKPDHCLPRIERRYTAAQLCRLLRLSPDRLRRWVRQGLVKPTETAGGVQFNFEQLTAVRTLWTLTQAGVSLGQIRRGLDQLRSWLPGEADEPLAHLPVIERDGRLLIRLDEGQLAEPSGQLHLDFAEQPHSPQIISALEAPSADDYWDRGIDLEEQGRLAEAEDAYRQALLTGGPHAQLCFNLGNVLYAQGHKEQAAERYHQAVELDPAFAEAWNNLGNALAALGQHERAAPAYRQALQHSPQYGDAHYNLADTLDTLGRRQEARLHWQRYLLLEPVRPWADRARQKLG